MFPVLVGLAFAADKGGALEVAIGVGGSSCDQPQPEKRREFLVGNLPWIFLEIPTLFALVFQISRDFKGGFFFSKGGDFCFGRLLRKVVLRKKCDSPTCKRDVSTIFSFFRTPLVIAGFRFTMNSRFFLGTALWQNSIMLWWNSIIFSCFVMLSNCWDKFGTCIANFRERFRRSLLISSWNSNQPAFLTDVW